MATIGHYLCRVLAEQNLKSRIPISFMLVINTLNSCVFFSALLFAITRQAQPQSVKTLDLQPVLCGLVYRRELSMAFI